MFARLVSPFKEFGPLAGSLYVIDRVLRRLSPSLGLYFYELMVQPIPDKPLLPPNFTRNLAYREIKRGDPEVDLMPARPDIKLSRFAQNAICLGAFHKGEFLGYIWFCFRSYDEDEVRCTYVISPPEQSVFDFDLYLFPKHRMGLGFAAIWNGANAFLRSRGIHHTFSRLTRFNVTSRRAHEHLGWKQLGHAIFFHAWALQVMVASLPPFISLSLGKSSRVRLDLRPDPLLS